MYPTRLYLFWNTIPSLEIPSNFGSHISEYHSYSPTWQNWLQVNLSFKNLQNAHNVQNTFFTFCWWRHSKYTDLSSIAHDIFSIVLYGVIYEGSFSLGRDLMGWRQCNATCKTLHQKVVLRQYARANTGILDRWWPSIEYDKLRQPLGNEQSSGGKKFTHNASDSRLFGDVAGQQKPMSYSEWMTCSKQADDSREIHFGPSRNCQCIQVAFSTWLCTCIFIVRKITFATSCFWKGHPCRKNWNMKCLPNNENEPWSSQKWWG